VLPLRELFTCEPHGVIFQLFLSHFRHIVITCYKTAAFNVLLLFCYNSRSSRYNIREAIGSYAENQRITAVRKVYQRGVVNPMLSIELLWKEYCAFEHVSSTAVISFCLCT